MRRILLLVWLFGASLPAFSQVDIRVLRQAAYVSLDTFVLTIDTADNSGTGANRKVVYFNIYNLSPAHAESFYMEAEWLCSNSSAYYQFCQEYPPDYTTGTCHVFHREGRAVYDDYDYSIPADTCGYNYLRCHFFIYDYSVEREHEKIAKLSVKRRNTHEALDSMYFIVRRGDLPCHADTGGGTALQTLSVDDDIAVYPNPASHSFTIAAKTGTWMGYALYAPDGRKLQDKPAGHNKSLDVPVETLPNGVYYLKLVDGKGASFYKKIVVEH